MSITLDVQAATKRVKLSPEEKAVLAEARAKIAAEKALETYIRKAKRPFRDNFVRGSYAGALSYWTSTVPGGGTLKYYMDKGIPPEDVYNKCQKVKAYCRKVRQYLEKGVKTPDRSIIRFKFTVLFTHPSEARYASEIDKPIEDFVMENWAYYRKHNANNDHSERYTATEINAVMGKHNAYMEKLNEETDKILAQLGFKDNKILTQNEWGRTLSVNTNHNTGKTDLVVNPQFARENAFKPYYDIIRDVEKRGVYITPSTKEETSNRMFVWEHLQTLKNPPKMEELPEDILKILLSKANRNIIYYHQNTGSKMQLTASKKES